MPTIHAKRKRKGFLFGYKKIEPGKYLYGPDGHEIQIVKNEVKDVRFDYHENDFVTKEQAPWRGFRRKKNVPKVAGRTLKEAMKAYDRCHKEEKAG